MQLSSSASGAEVVRGLCQAIVSHEEICGCAVILSIPLFFILVLLFFDHIRNRKEYWIFFRSRTGCDDFRGAPHCDADVHDNSMYRVPQPSQYLFSRLVSVLNYPSHSLQACSKPIFKLQNHLATCPYHRSHVFYRKICDYAG